MAKTPTPNLAETAYDRIKNDIFAFRLLPGDRFTETEIAACIGVSRTPVREALNKLKQQGYVQLVSRNGWNVTPFDFARYDNLYDIRVILELAAVRKLALRSDFPDFNALCDIWLVPPEARRADPHEVARLDEQFHEKLVDAAGNPELTRIYEDVVERIRVIRRLDFTRPDRIAYTYDEHAQILRSLLRRNADRVTQLLRAHIETSKMEVRKITLHKLHMARTSEEAD
jgi:DNA-binding GntR family transcriptional regulator